MATAVERIDVLTHTEVPRETFLTVALSVLAALQTLFSAAAAKQTRHSSSPTVSIYRIFAALVFLQYPIRSANAVCLIAVPGEGCVSGAPSSTSMLCAVGPAPVACTPYSPVNGDQTAQHGAGPIINVSYFWRANDMTPSLHSPTPSIIECFVTRRFYAPAVTAMPLLVGFILSTAYRSPSISTLIYFIIGMTQEVSADNYCGFGSWALLPASIQCRDCGCGHYCTSSDAKATRGDCPSGTWTDSVK